LVILTNFFPTLGTYKYPIAIFRILYSVQDGFRLTA